MVLTIQSSELNLPEPHPDLEVCVVVPCKNEGKELEATLTALAKQTLSKNRWEVLLLVNNSSDDSFARANKFKHGHPELSLHVIERNFPPEQAIIGNVRRYLMDLAFERLTARPKAFSLIASTDADTEVASDWLVQNLAECRNGAEAIGGRITVRPSDLQSLDQRTRRIQMLDEQYRLLTARLEDFCDPQAHDPWPRHHQHFAASLSVRPEVYKSVGGLPPKKSLEDVAFFEALIRQDVRFRHSPEVCAVTSGRLDGKTPIGLAEQLTSWEKNSSGVRVPSVDFLRAVFSFRREMRIAWGEICSGRSYSRPRMDVAAASLGIPIDSIEEALSGKWFGAAFESLAIESKLKEVMGDAAFQPLESAAQELMAQFPTAIASIEEVPYGISVA